MDKIIVDIVGTSFAGIGVVGGLLQYMFNSRRANAARAAEEIESIYREKYILTAEKLLDYPLCKIGYERPSGQIEEIVVDELGFHLALRHHTVRRCEVPGYDPQKDGFLARVSAPGVDPQYLFSGREHFIRDVFDRFFGRLERIEALISARVITASDFRDHFSYWITVIGDPHAPVSPLSAAKRATLIDYIVRYDFKGVIRLFARYDKDLSLPAVTQPPHAPATAWPPPPAPRP